ncbi:mitochondrial carnitine/acylcarnitine carrier protein [Orussus abietinus]|uniref:mitochondrial carnitine/acylcarnitine carrier protein n=1 Tax=Orussus abietinus TaxID=222816 RepID=UPI0006257C25|nr:mitochondrial carnitine/acylcarnitine carrier protein [Orussus abietinus]
MSQERSPLKYLIAGAFGGVCTVLSGHPLDTIKVRIQTRPEEYKGTVDAVQKILTREGPLGLYKGMSAPLLSIVPMFSITFLGFGFGKKLVSKPDQEVLTRPQLVLAGMFSGACTTVITVPGERIKCLLQVQAVDSRKYTGFADCAVKLWKEGGIRNFYVGTCATLLRDVPATGVYFFTYETIGEFLARTYGEAAMWQPLVAGGCAGIMNWVVGMPADVMKSRLQTAPLGTYPRGVRSLFPELVRQEGLLVMYRGVGPVMIRAFPANAACFVGLETAMKFLDAFLPWL